MQLFLFLNDLAGRFPFLDEIARYFYIGAVPLLATLFLGQLTLVSRESNGAKVRLALSVLLALLLLGIIGLTVEFFAKSWHLGTLSPRPFMTRRINWLVVEPQDNSFPCYEVAIAAILAMGMAFSSRKWGIAGAVLTVFFGLTRMFCGNNFLADVAVGALLGSGLCAASVALWTSPRPFEGALRNWATASAVVFATLGASYVSFAQKPRFASKMPLFWGSKATAAPETAHEHGGARKATRAARAAIGEGEGLVESTALNGAAGEPPGEPTAEALALSKRSHLFLPEVEKYLRGKLAPRARPFVLLDVEVAPVRAGNTTYRSAAIRFEINQKVPDLRRRTAAVAAALTKLAFQSDSNLQNVDITAVLRGDGAQIDGSQVNFAGDEVPVFTASIAREKLRLTAPRWANDPKLDAGLWLRTRSRLFINDKILPAAPLPTPTSVPAPKLIAKPIVQPTAQPIAKPTVKPIANPAISSPTPVASPSLSAPAKTTVKAAIKPPAIPKTAAPQRPAMLPATPKPATTPKPAATPKSVATPAKSPMPVLKPLSIPTARPLQ